MDNLGLPPTDLDSSAKPTIIAVTNPTPPDVMMASKMAPSRASFNPTGEFVTWRGFQVTHSNQAILERLLVRFPQTLDHLIVHEASLVTCLLDRLASFILEMQSLSLHNLRVEDLDKLSHKVTDFSSLGFDVSPFRTRLDLIIQDHHTAMLREEVAIRHDSYHQYSEEFSKVQTAISSVKIKLREYNAMLQEYESAARDIERIMKDDVHARDVAVANLEALAMPPLQFDMTWPLTYGLL